MNKLNLTKEQVEEIRRIRSGLSQYKNDPPKDDDSLTADWLTLFDENERLRKENELLIEALSSVKQLDHCVFYDSALWVIYEKNAELAERLFNQFKYDWEDISFEDYVGEEDT